MQRHYEYQFEWDPIKARSNAKKHGVAFERAATVFQDSSALSRFDTDHSESEDRWVPEAPVYEFFPHGRLLKTKPNNTKGDKTMKREYDFSKAERGKFYRRGTLLRLPIYLEPTVQRNLEKIARRKHRPVSEMVNEFVRKEVEMIGNFL